VEEGERERRMRIAGSTAVVHGSRPGAVSLGDSHLIHIIQTTVCTSSLVPHQRRRRGPATNSAETNRPSKPVSLFPLTPSQQLIHTHHSLSRPTSHLCDQMTTYAVPHTTNSLPIGLKIGPGSAQDYLVLDHIYGRWERESMRDGLEYHSSDSVAMYPAVYACTSLVRLLRPA
jgi:hypothetical protein